MGTKYKQKRGPSILQTARECYVTRKRYGVSDDCDLVLHHIFMGKNREMSDAHGFWCWLKVKYHDGTDYAVHKKYGHDLDLELKQDCQRAFEAMGHSRQEFADLVGESYL